VGIEAGNRWHAYRISLRSRSLSGSAQHVAGTRVESESLTFPVEGVDGGSVSMLAVRVG